MKPAEKLVGVAMALYADYETGENVCPSNGTIARELGYGGKAPEQTVNKIVGRLRKAGWLTKTGKVPDGPVIYRLTLPKEGGMAEEPYNLHTFKSDGDGSSKPVGEERLPTGGRQGKDEGRKQPAKVGRVSGPQQEDIGAGSLGGLRPPPCPS
ncbi:helix-turn-helix domain-containing protein [Streptomyces sp. NBC_00996]|uniref:helix-turn-helix domain-containing protein n=1 Tax=Streptomyces sp. NBC_00996 TaxID=2903710 RepID=UPI003870377A|nr:helix-turn-helix domain-containing protein [Streptomyces sp. NBC_00996]